MAVVGLLSFTLKVPDLETGVRFYTEAGLMAEVDGDRAQLRCAGQQRASIMLVGGAPAKRLHHVTLRAEGLDVIAARATDAGGDVADAPTGFEDNGLWVRDPRGILYHLVEHASDPELTAGPAFEINAPGRLVRRGRSAVKPVRDYPAAAPHRLGHVMLFTPDVPASVRFVVEGLGMGLADRAQDVVAFTCAVRDSDHHVVAFAKSPGIGFHHASFQVDDPDAVGRNGRALLASTGRGDWGVGRHTIGSNFFHYVQDPWGSWFEYFSDMDHIEDHSLWTPRNYDLVDSLANWGPPVPDDFVRNGETEDVDNR